MLCVSKCLSMTTRTVLLFCKPSDLRSTNCDVSVTGSSCQVYKYIHNACLPAVMEYLHFLQPQKQS